LTVLVIYLKGSLILIVVSQLLVAIGVALAWFSWTPKKYFAIRTSGRSVIDFFRNSALFGFSNMIWVAYFNFDIFLMSLLRPGTEVGIYAGVYRIIAINYVLGMAVANSFTPILFGKFASNRQEFGRVSRNLVATMSLIGLLLSLLLYSYSGRLVSMIIGELYKEGAVIARILSLAVTLRLVNFGLCEILTTGNRQRVRVSVEMAMLLSNVVLNGILIPLYGGIGAAIATVGSEITLLIAAALACRSYGLLWFSTSRSAHPS
jgi:O-antigen/teichoic acid export membrane protein